MTPAETSRALAIAIGYRPEHVRINGDTCAVDYVDPEWGEAIWTRIFDYRDPAVIWRVAERYNCFPRRLEGGGWYARAQRTLCPYTADTAAEAVALAVIGNSKA